MGWNKLLSYSTFLVFFGGRKGGKEGEEIQIQKGTLIKTDFCYIPQMVVLSSKLSEILCTKAKSSAVWLNEPQQLQGKFEQ